MLWNLKYITNHDALADISSKTNNKCVLVYKNNFKLHPKKTINKKMISFSFLAQLQLAVNLASVKFLLEEIFYLIGLWPDLIYSDNTCSVICSFFYWNCNTIGMVLKLSKKLNVTRKIGNSFWYL